ncbi:DUF981 family protein [Elizabethkingia anophelis]|nr:DUF981 family protein [Elizabethkingia anophelis]MCT4063414.1 DUF981 family protein [Elizabethkingia anophelis]MCT4109706.1 DUF981 family protein [Elizabethkingia anophelis]
MKPDKLIIDWSQLPTYNTIMALMAGVALISIARTGKSFINNKKINPKGWALNFCVTGLILLLTGLHMTLTWPFAKYFPFDNIIFGEPSLAFGVLLLSLSFYLWTHAEVITNNDKPLEVILNCISPFSTLLYALSFMLLLIFFAGVNFQFFAAPSEEPISGNFADYPWLESWGLSLIFLAIGTSSFLTGRFLSKDLNKVLTISIWDKINYALLLLTGWFLLLFGAMNYYTHIGLIINTLG